MRSSHPTWTVTGNIIPIALPRVGGALSGDDQVVVEARELPGEGEAVVVTARVEADGSLTRLFFLICCKDESTHLHVLARLATMLHDQADVEDLIADFDRGFAAV